MVTAAAAAAAANAPNRQPNLFNASDTNSTIDGQLQRSNSSNPAEQITLHITLERSPGGGLGLSIAGGVGSIPFRGLDQGIFVSRLAVGGLAETSGLKVGDKVLEVRHS